MRLITAAEVAKMPDDVIFLSLTWMGEGRPQILTAYRKQPGAATYPYALAGVEFTDDPQSNRTAKWAAECELLV